MMENDVFDQKNNANTSLRDVWLLKFYNIGRGPNLTSWTESIVASSEFGPFYSTVSHFEAEYG